MDWEKTPETETFTVYIQWITVVKCKIDIVEGFTMKNRYRARVLPK